MNQEEGSRKENKTVLVLSLGDRGNKGWCIFRVEISRSLDMKSYTSKGIKDDSKDLV